MRIPAFFHDQDLISQRDAALETVGLPLSDWDPVPAVLPAGGVSVHDWRTLHGCEYSNGCPSHLSTRSSDATVAANSGAEQRQRHALLPRAALPHRPLLAPLPHAGRELSRPVPPQPPAALLPGAVRRSDGDSRRQDAANLRRLESRKALSVSTSPKPQVTKCNRRVTFSFSRFTGHLHPHPGRSRRP